MKKMVCPKCGRTYTDDSHCCIKDGTPLVEAEMTEGESPVETPEKPQQRDLMEVINRTITDMVDGVYNRAKAFSKKNKWHVAVTFWAFLFTLMSAIKLIKSVIGLGHSDWYRWVVMVLLIINIFAVLFLLNRKKSGFYLLCASVMINIICSFIYGYASGVFFGLISVFVWYAILQIKYTDPATGEEIKAWDTLQ